MSMSDSDSSSSHFGDHKTFRQIGRDRLLYEMLRSTKVKDSKSKWKVLIMDKITVKVMSYSCKMADITEEGVSLVEDLDKRRQPLPSMDAIYFMQPTREKICQTPIGAISKCELSSVVRFLADMSGRSPLYKKAFVFFSSPVNKDLVALIKRDSSVLPRIGALSETNLEYFAIDSQGFVTDHERALEELFGENAEGSHKYNACLNTMAIRISTVLASLRIAPIIHEWTYDAMCHDLLNMEGNKYTHQVPSKMGSTTEKKEVLLEDHDPIWLELRDSHIADASERLHEKMTNFISKNKAAQIHSSRDGGELSTRDLQKMVQALPQYSEQIDKLSLHVEIAGKINKIIREQGLREIGQLEQDLVFGDAGTKELIQFLRTKQDASRESKLRLMMIYASINPEKFEGDRASKLMQLAQLSSDDMIAVNNMRYLGTSDNKKASGSTFSLKFDMSKKKHGIRKERKSEEETWQLSRFYPLIEELIEKLSKGELSKDDYPCLNDPCATVDGTSRVSVRTTHSMPAPAQSVRSRPTPTWARPRSSDDGYSSDSVLRHASSDFKRMGQRMFIFIIGGATRSELRVVHKLTSKLKREIILGSSSLDDPPQFITKLKLMSAQEISLDELQI
ncbi:hypothetical protein ZIOFF_044219 [Zingiber officinale]|uniref:SNARE-interacting protein KEULE n=1 Tax=Zingiber officinale TaxID=94328 RepID=A0A8J5KR28_ZINOF|nr:hypothetical protein ZIOFF_044219 [Zingiber officinale]